MKIKIPHKTSIENFVIENNVIKGVSEELPNTHYFGKLILDHLDTKPHHVAQIDTETGQQTTYAEMRDRSIRCATWMKKQGIGHGATVIICSDNILDVYIPIFATFYLEATFSSWSHLTPIKLAQYLMKVYKPKVIFACESAVDNLLKAAKLEHIPTKIIVFENHSYLESLNEILDHQSDEEVQDFQVEKRSQPDDVAFIILSSGSTGLPKGVMHSFLNLTKIVTCFMTYRMKGITLCHSPCFWISGFRYLFKSLFMYGTRIIQKVFDAEATCQVIEKYKVQRFFGTPAIITHMCKTNILKKYKLPSLKLVIFGGSKINPKILDEFKNSLPHTVVLQAYGSSETGSYTMMQTENSKSAYSIGFVGSLVELKIVDLDTGKILGPNQPGELHIKSSIMMLGYYKNPEITKASFDNAGWFHTGDKAYYDENGEFFIEGRLREIIKYRNHCISPFEIEEVLLLHPDVLEVTVVPLPHKFDGEQPMAYVKKIPGSNVTAEELVEMSEVLGDIKKLRGGVQFLSDLPKTQTGKLLRKILEEMAKALVQVM